MIKLTTLLKEFRPIEEEQSEASKQAEKLGLVHKGWGRYADPQTGSIVAYVRSGHLVKVDKDGKVDGWGGSRDDPYSDHDEAWDQQAQLPGREKEFQPGQMNPYFGKRPEQEPEWMPTALNHFGSRRSGPAPLDRKRLYPGYDPGQAQFRDDPDVVAARQAEKDKYFRDNPDMATKPHWKD